MSQVLDLDPFIMGFRADLDAGNATEGDRFMVRAADYDTVRWTGPDGVVNEVRGRVEVFEVTPIVLGRL